MKKLLSLIKRYLAMTKAYDVPADHAFSRQTRARQADLAATVYARADQRHLTKLPQAAACAAWHTSLDIQAVRKNAGQVRLFIGGHEVGHDHPEQAVIYLATQDIEHAKKQCKLLFGVRL
jgi:hypothetical protein